MTNRGVYPPSAVTDGVQLAHVFDYYRSSISASRELVLQRLEEGLSELGRPVTRADGARVRYYASTAALVDTQGRVVANDFSGGSNVRPNVVA